MRYATLLIIKTIFPALLLWIVHGSQDVVQDSVQVICQNIHSDTNASCITYFRETNPTNWNPFYGFSIGMLLAILLPNSSSVGIIFIISLVGGRALIIKDAFPIVLGCNVASTFDYTRNTLMKESILTAAQLRSSGIVLQNVHSFVLCMFILTLDILISRILGTNLTTMLMNNLIAVRDTNKYLKMTGLNTGLANGLLEVVNLSGNGIGNAIKVFLGCFTLLIGSIVYITMVCDACFGDFVRRRLRSTLGAERNCFNFVRFLLQGFVCGFIVQRSDFVYNVAVQSLGKSVKTFDIYSVLIGANIATSFLPILAVINWEAFKIWLYNVFVQFMGILLIFFAIPRTLSLQLQIAKCASRIKWNNTKKITYLYTYFIVVPAVLLLFSLIDPVISLILFWSVGIIGTINWSYRDLLSVPTHGVMPVLRNLT